MLTVSAASGLAAGGEVFINLANLEKIALEPSFPGKNQKSRPSPRFTKDFLSLVLGNNALQFAPDET